MKIIHITELELLKAYVAKEFPTSTAVAIDLYGSDSSDEHIYLMGKLKGLGIIPDTMYIPGWFIFETTPQIASILIQDDGLRGHTIYAFSGGMLVSENR